MSGVALFTAILLLLQAVQGDPVPLPESGPFAAAVRENLSHAAEVQDRFAYKERRTEVRTNPFGRLGTGDIVVYDIVPNAEGTSLTRRLVERAGAPVPDGQVEKREIRGRRRARGAMEDVYGVLDLTVERREIVGGHRTIVVTFKPNPEAKPQTREGRLARSFKGTVWVNEDAREVERIEAIAAEPISFGLGLVARLSEGAKVTMTRAPGIDGVWLPVGVRFVGEGRALLFRKLDLEFSIDWFDYRKVE